MKWLSNIYDPSQPDAPMKVVRLYDETREEAWLHHMEWLQGKAIGEPQATGYVTVDQLKAWHYVGVYEEVE